MALFGFGKKKEEVIAPACCCSENSVDTSAYRCDCTPKEEPSSCCCGAPVADICCIKVLGAGCKACHEQYEHAKAAVKSMGLSAEVEYITDMQKVMEYGVMSMPALVVNEKVVSVGKVLKAADVEKLLHKLGF